MLALAIFMFSTSFAQDPSVITIESQLSDIEGTNISNSEIGASLLILNSSGQLSYENDFSLTTNDQGVFLMYIEDIPDLFVNGEGSDPVVMKITLTSSENDTWLEEDQFVVKYMLKCEGDKENRAYSLTRTEGQQLNYEYQSDIWKFQDIYPFAYIKSTFLFSFNKDITDAKSLLMVANEFFKESELDEEDMVKEKEAAPSRGIKGGYAVGGIQKK